MPGRREDRRAERVCLLTVPSLVDHHVLPAVLAKEPCELAAIRAEYRPNRCTVAFQLFDHLTVHRDAEVVSPTKDAPRLPMDHHRDVLSVVTE
jgi:hypothetical protein